MRFVFQLSFREFRSSWRRLLFFFLCIAIGVGSIVALRSLVKNLSHAVGGDARALLTADVSIESNNPFSPTELGTIESVVEASGIATGNNELLETSAMARPLDSVESGVRFVLVRAIEAPFPLVGDFKMSGGKAFDFTLLKGNGLVASPVLLEELGIRIGDRLKIGEKEFVIRGTYESEPGGSGGFQLGSRVYVSKSTFEQSGIVENRSRVRRRLLFRTSANPTPLVESLREKFKGTPIRIRSYRETQENISEQFEKTEDYLSLTGLLILVLGGVGVWNVARVFVEQKRKSVAILKCVGARGRQIIAAYMLQIGGLGFLGGLFGIALAQIALMAGKSAFNDALPADMTFNVSWQAALQGLFLGMVISLLFSALPLLQIRNIKPNLLLRDDNNDKINRLDPLRWITGLGVVAGLLGLSVWQAGSLLVGVFFLAGLTIAASVLYFSAWLVVRSLAGLKKAGGFSISQALNSLSRPGNQTTVILLAVGLGAFVVIAVNSLERNLVREFDFSRNQRLPSFFFFDIQPSQIGEFTKLMNGKLGEKAEIIPTVRARISHVNGKPIDFNEREVREQQGQIGREFAVTYRDRLDDGEELKEGYWWNEIPADLPQVSVLESLADTLKLKTGDSITFTISGKSVTALVANIRKLDARNTRTVFIFVFRPGVLDSAPKSFAANVLKRLPANDRQRLQRDVIERFPNIQIVDVAEIVAVVQKLVANFVLAISFVGSFVIFSGILILIGSVSLTKAQRIYENAVLKTLGARRMQLSTILVAEYGILGLLAGLIGSSFAFLLSWAVSIFVLDIEWSADPVLLVMGILGTALLVAGFGTLASFDVLFRKPLGTLRQQ
ncbi:MAG: FtsX-like permease family protein [Pyrinomonadaceae bacterium]